jgi:hypothetical protein
MMVKLSSNISIPAPASDPPAWVFLLLLVQFELPRTQDEIVESRFAVPATRFNRVCALQRRLLFSRRFPTAAARQEIEP